MKKSFVVVVTSLAPLVCNASVVYLADSVASVASFQPFSATNAGTFSNGTISSGVTDLATALGYSSTPAGAAGTVHLNGRFEPATTAADKVVTYSYTTPRDLSGVILWNYNEFWTGNNQTYSERGLTRADITVTHSGGTFVLDNVPFTLTPDSNSATQTHTAQQVSFGTDLSGVTSIVLDDIQGGAGQVGWMDFAAVAVPEPSSTTILGLAGMLVLLRRRR